jgi:hypothetical protein
MYTHYVPFLEPLKDLFTDPYWNLSGTLPECRELPEELWKVLVYQSFAS